MFANMFATRAAILLTVLCSAACSFDSHGLVQHNTDGGPGSDAATSPIDAPKSGTPDATPAPIDAPMPTTSGVLNARFTSTPISLDGVADDWFNAEWVTFDIADSAQFFGVVPEYKNSAVATFAALHDTTYLYFFFEVVDDVVNSDSDRLKEDDHIRIYLDSLGDRAGPYGIDDHDIGVSADNFFFDYFEASADITLSGQVRLTEAGYDIEIRIRKSTVGAPLGSILGFNVAIGDDDGHGEPDQDAYGLWYLPPGPHCSACCSGFVGAPPSCDTSMFGQLVLIAPGS